MMMMNKDDEVEVMSEEEGFRGAWFKAVLEENTTKSGRKKIRVRYLTLLADDNSSPLIETIVQSFIRPIPPVEKYNDVVFEEGLVVDADHKDGWWKGVIIKEMKQGKYLVYFDSPPDIIQFDKNQLRAHIIWNGWIWVRPEIVEVDKSKYCPGTIVEVSSVLDKEETAWVPSMIVTETDEEDNKKMFIVKYCNKYFNCNGDEARENPTVDFSRIRPVPPPHSVEEYKLLDPVEAFRGSSWRQGLVRGILSERRYVVSLGASVGESVFKHSDLRPFMEWEGGIWRNRSIKQQTVKETPSSSVKKRSIRACSSGIKSVTLKSNSLSLKRTLNCEETPESVTIAEVSRKKMAGAVTDDNTPLSVILKVKPKAKDPVSSVTPSPVTTSKPVAGAVANDDDTPSVIIQQVKPIAATPLKLVVVETGEKTLEQVKNQRAMKSDSTQVKPIAVSSVTPSPVITASPLKQPVAKTGEMTSFEKTLEQVKNQRAMETDSTQVKPIEKEAISSVTPSPVITTSPLKQPVAETGEMTSFDKTLEQVRNQLKTTTTQQKMPEEENSKESRKRKREQEQHSNSNKTVFVDETCNGSSTEIDNMTSKKICNDGDANDQPLSSLIERSPDQTLNMVKSSSVAITHVDETRGEDRVTSLPFAKNSPYWKTFETTESFKTVPQRPHFSPLCDAKEELREWSAVGMMVTFYGLLDEVKGLKLDDPPSKLNGLSVSLAELEKHGFEVEAAQSRIRRMMSLQEDRKMNTEEKKCLEEKIEEKVNETRKVEEELADLKRRVLELERLQAVAKEKKEEGEKEMVEMKSSVETIEGKLEEVEIEFQKTASAPW